MPARSDRPCPVRDSPQSQDTVATQLQHPHLPRRALASRDDHVESSAVLVGGVPRCDNDGQVFVGDGPGAPLSAFAHDNSTRQLYLIRRGEPPGSMSRPQARPRSRVELRTRRQRRHSCWDHLLIAPLWPQHGLNLGTLLRTCDAVGACMAVPRLPWVPEALARGNTLRSPACVHWTGNDVDGWLQQQTATGTHLIGVELVEDAVALADLPAARRRTIAVLGHENSGIPAHTLDLIDVFVEIPMVGTGASLNVAVAGSLVLYRLAGLM
jgi:tRNA (guanosine-2'-O-)-methyltransferase